MKIILAMAAAIALAGLSVSASAQPPPGSYRQSCRDIRMQGSTLTALCRTAHGHGDRLTALNVARCVGDIGNNNGQLQCNGGRPAAPLPPGQGSGPGYAPSPGYPGPGYGPPGGGPPPVAGPPPRYSEGDGYRQRCDGLRHEEHELRDRLASTPYGEERERVQYRLGQVHAAREQCRL